MILQRPLPVPFAGASPVRLGALAGALFALTKPRLACFSILSGVTGYAVVPRADGGSALLAALAGITLSAGGALALNQWWERDTDALMRRTANRPLPAGRIGPAGALVWALALGAGGVGLLAITSGRASAMIAAAIIVAYGLVYTPMKRRTRWATEVGSVSGAMPPLLGAAAAGEIMAPGAWLLAGILLLWQMPHFFAIGWMHRADYRRAGFPMRPALDRDGWNTAAWSVGYAGALAALSVLPWTVGWAGPIYGVPATVGAGVLLVAAVRWLREPDDRDRRARQLFRATLWYLPPVMAAVALDFG